ncbi:exodeoxyribonuclease VII small subunit [Eubacteriales bacterium OttesenSCG-928-N13]|nr:exodeoxyribonuclease VII small subunit [Eubacteriales bacterium OttesenSCG-928-N13]
MAKRESEMSFEQGLEQLEALVRALEEGKLPLDESFDAYEQGMKLLGKLEAQLKTSEAKIKQLTKTGERDLTEED